MVVQQHAPGDEQRAGRKLGPRVRQVGVIVFNDVITGRIAAEIVTEGGREGLGRRECRSAGDFVRPDGMGLPPEPAKRVGQFQAVLGHPKPGVQRHRRAEQDAHETLPSIGSYRGRVCLQALGHNGRPREGLQYPLPTGPA